MAMQLKLFNVGKGSLSAMLQRAASNGRLFYSVRQVANMLQLSGFRVYYLVYNYRLDALWVAGEYRIPFTAIIDYIADRSAISRQFFDYIAFTESRTIRGALAYRMSSGSGAVPTYPDGEPVGSHLREAILGRIWPSKKQSACESDPIDWYGLEDLRLPHRATTETWARLLALSEEQLLSDSDWEQGQVITWPEMYDWMIDREVVNLPVPYRFVTPKKSVEQRPVDRAQLLLGL